MSKQYMYRIEPTDDFEELLRGANISTDELLSSVRQKALAQGFPSSSCLTPPAVAHYAETGEMSPEEHRHVGKCKYCRGLVSVLVPNPELLREFREEVRRIPIPGARRASSSKHLRKPTWESWQIPSFWVPVLACATFVVLLVLLLQSPYLQRILFPTQESANVTDGKNTSPNKAQIAVRDKNDPQNPLVLRVGFENQRIMATDYPKVAAGIVTQRLVNQNRVEGELGSESAASRQNANELRQKLAVGLEQYYAAGESGPGGVEITCESLAQDPAWKDLQIRPSEYKGKCVVSIGKNLLAVDPQSSFYMTDQYVKALQRSNGDLSAVNRLGPDVQVNVIK